MKSKEGKAHEQSSSNSTVDDLLVRDLSRFVAHWSRLYGDKRTGNVKMSKALRELGRALRPYANTPISELAGELRKQRAVRSSRKSPTKSDAPFPENITELSARAVEKLLASHNYTKAQLIQLGVSRFGISRSKLSGLLKGDVLESVRAALEHEISLVVISEEARRRGRERSP